jgi:tetratricopeptide (TPR) repeat protein
MMIMMIDRIIHVNNKAVSFLAQSGDYFGAAFFLCMALETMNGYEHLCVEEEEDNTDLSSGTIRLIPTRVREASSALPNDSKKVFESDTNAVDLYDNAFFVVMLPPCSSSDGSSAANEARCMNSLCPILRYNLGLSLQLQGISDHRIQKSSFHESSILYHNASALLDAASDTTNEANILLRLALFNNLGHIYYQLSMPTEAQECLDHVKIMLLAATDNQWGDEEEGGEYKQFFTSVLVNSGQHTRTSPAA